MLLVNDVLASWIGGWVWGGGTLWQGDNPQNLQYKTNLKNQGLDFFLRKEGSVGTCWAGALPMGLNRTQRLQHQTNMFRHLIASEVSDGKQSL